MKMNLSTPVFKNTLLVFTYSLTAFGCVNVFAPFDSPQGDAQILSKARACFDQGDYACALDYYGRLAGNEEARAEEAFVILDQEGSGISALVQAVGLKSGESVGSILTTMVEKVYSGASSTRRNHLATAYTKVGLITNQTLRGFVRFTTAFALAADLLAEETDVQVNGTFEKADYLDTSGSCSASSCAVGASCSDTSTNFTVGTDTPFITTPSDVTASMSADANPTWFMFLNAIKAAGTGLTEMGVATGSSFDLINSLTAIAVSTNSGNCMRAALLSVNVGRD